jgi:DNA invertase Pin-like site-specific DNA recombinase
MPAEGRLLRCAVYTRKSSEEGLEQSFNSLAAQREACLAYIESQRHEGWRALENVYDDGGYSGGNIERPALTRLLADIEARRIDAVVVYKVDRLTRSLTDFAKIVERFDAQGVSFVSVTQQFNTTSSMGRLTLNVLLSFAQFEREVTGERIRDKIAASKKKGMWMGGGLPLGYEVADRKLLPNAEDAERVRMLYRLYLKLGCVAKLKAKLDREGIRSKERTSRRGRKSGGVSYSRGALYDLLQNRVYLGEIKHHRKFYPGSHAPIVDRALWDKVQAKLKANRQAVKHGLRAREPSLLLGMLYDAQGSRFTPSHASKAGKRYRYYLNQPALLGAAHRSKGAKPSVRIRLPARDIEEVVCRRLCAFLESEDELLAALSLPGESDAMRATLAEAARERAATWPLTRAADIRAFLMEMVASVTVHEAVVEIKISKAALRSALLGIEGQRIEIPAPAPSGRPEDIVYLRVDARLNRSRGEVRLIAPEQANEPRSASANAALLKALARARRWYEMLISGEALSLQAIAKATGLDQRYVSRVARLAFLAPEIVEGILEGRQPFELTLDTIFNPFPANWAEQKDLFAS